MEGNMKRLPPIIALLTGLLVLLGASAYDSEESLLFLKSWTETTESDFSDSELEDVVVTNWHGGEVELRRALVKTVPDYREDNVARFVAWDSSRSFYLASWVENRNVYVQKFAANGSVLGQSIRVNERDGCAGYSGSSRTALMNDGTFMVTWVNWGSDSFDNNMYGQLFKDDSVRVGGNFKINQGENAFDIPPIVFANNEQKTFWLLFEEGNHSEGWKIFVKTYDLNSSFLNFFRLNAENLTYLEMVYSISVSNNGEFIVAWTGGDNSVSTSQDVYTRKFSHRGEPLSPAFKVNDDAGKNDQYQPAVCVDDSSNYLIVWVDMRDNTFEAGPYDYNIYGQFYTPDAQKVGRNFMVNTPLNEDDREPDVQFINGAFRISWHSWNALGRITETYVTSWQYKPTFSGTLISSVFDAGPSFIKYQSIAWDGSLPESTSIRFQLRSSQHVAEINQAPWHGPSETNAFYSISGGEAINQVHNGDRYIQYKVQFSTAASIKTPILYSVTISYSPSDSTPPNPPANFKAAAGHSNIVLSWAANAEPDLAKYLLYRGETSGVYDSVWTKIIMPTLTTFADTSAITGKVYYYALSAIDSSHNESLLSPEVSAIPYGISVWVDDDNEPSGDGSYSNPFKTIKEALTKAIYGDSVVVLPGVYRETVEIKTGVSLVGSGAKVTQIIAPGDKEYVVNCADDAVLRGLSIIRNKASIQMAVRCLEVSPIIEDNIITNYGASGQGSPAIWAVTAFPIIKRNFISDFEYGVFAYNYQGVQGRTIAITNNVIKSTEVGIKCTSHTHGEIMNNTILTERSTCVLSSQNSWLVIKNNILYGLDSTKASGIFDRRSSKIHLDYNDVWNMRENYSDVIPGTHDISADPLFVNIAKNDYRLTSSSPCIDAGDPDSPYNDRDKSRNDLGAFGGPDPLDQQLTMGLAKSIGVDGGSAFPGDTVSTFVWLDDPIGLAKAHFEIQFDPSILKLIGVLSTKQTAHFDFEQSDRKGEIIISMQSSREIAGGDGKILRLTFIVDENAKSGDASPLSIKGASMFDGLGNPIQIKNIADGAFVVSHGSLNGRYIFVDANNEDTEDGSIHHPFQTIQQAIEQATAGDTVIVAAGKYFGPLFMKEGVFLRGAGASVTSLYHLEDYFDLVVFENVTIGGLSGFTMKVEESPALGPLITCRASSPIITRNRFEAPFEPTPIMGLFDQSSPLIERNYFVNGGIMAEQSSPIIIDNTFDCEIGNPIQCAYSSSPQIINNRFWANEYLAIFLNGSSARISGNWIVCGKGEIHGIHLEEVTQVDISNNIIDGPNDDAMGIFLVNSSQVTISNNTIMAKGKGLWEENSTSAIFNNIITGARGFGIQYSPTSDEEYNDIWNNANNYYYCSPGANDISADPLFLDSINSDYHLKAESPCIDSGHPDAKYNDPDGSRNDMGAYGGPDAQILENYLSPVRLELPSVEAAANDTVQIELCGKAISGAAEMNLTVSYDPQVLRFLSARTAQATSHFSLTKAESEAADLQFTLVSPEGIKSDSGAIIELSMQTGGQIDSEGHIIIKQASIKDEMANELTIGGIVNGKIKITKTGVGTPNNSVQPYRYVLSQNYPNPFNSTTIIRFSLAKPEHVLLKIYDILGRQVRTLIDRKENAGEHAVRWDGRNDHNIAVPSEVYIYKMTAGSFVQNRKLAIVR